MEQTTKQGYGIAFLKLIKPQKWMIYGPKAGPLAKKHGASFAAGGKLATAALYAERDTTKKFDLGVLMEYPTFEHAKSFYNSPVYQSELLPLRLDAAKGPFVLTEGVARPPDMTGILIAAVKMTNPEEMKKYNPAKSIETYGGIMLFRDFNPSVSDGFQDEFNFVVALAFPTAQKATLWMESKEYKEMKELRLANSVGPTVILDASKE